MISAHQEVLFTDFSSLYRTEVKSLRYPGMPLYEAVNLIRKKRSDFSCVEVKYATQVSSRWKLSCHPLILLLTRSPKTFALRTQVDVLFPGIVRSGHRDQLS